MTARFIVGDALTVLRSMPDASVHSVITSPPYLAKRSYLPYDHPEKAQEIGQERSPGDFLASLLVITDELWRVLRDDGTIWINLGDTASGSGGAGGDYNDGGLRDGQPRFRQVASPGWPLAKSVCWVPELFGASLAYGRNLLTGERCRHQWITRPPVTWCKPNPSVGEIIDKFREATELIVWASKQPRYYFDLDAVRTPHTEPIRENVNRPKRQTENGVRGNGGDDRGYVLRTGHPLGAPPLNWWEIPTSPYPGAHFATFPPALIRLPVIVSCPEGGTILDPFAGSGTTLAVAVGHGRDAIGIDLDERNAELARERVGMFLETDSLVPSSIDVPTGTAL